MHCSPQAFTKNEFQIFKLLNHVLVKKQYVFNACTNKTHWFSLLKLVKYIIRKNMVSNYYVAYKSGILCDKKNDCLKKTWTYQNKFVMLASDSEFMLQTDHVIFFVSIRCYLFQKFNVHQNGLKKFWSSHISF